MNITIPEPGLQVPGIVKIGEEVHAADYYHCYPGRWPHHQITIQITLQGSGCCWPAGKAFPDRQLAVPLGSALIFDNRSHHLLEYGLDERAVHWRVLYVNLSGSVATQVVEELVERLGHVIPIDRQDPLLAYLSELLPKDGVAHRVWPWTEMANLALRTLAWCSAGWKAEATCDEHEDLVGRARQLIYERFYEEWPVRRLAAELGVTREHLTRVFSANVGVPPSRWLKQRRVEAACSFLRGGAPISEIATRCGFTTVNFAQAFRSLTGLTPSEFRAGGGKSHSASPSHATRL